MRSLSRAGGNRASAIDGLRVYPRYTKEVYRYVSLSVFVGLLLLSCALPRLACVSGSRAGIRARSRAGFIYSWNRQSLGFPPFSTGFSGGTPLVYLRDGYLITLIFNTRHCLEVYVKVQC